MSIEYQLAVLVDVPVLYPRLDMTGPATDGDSIPDLSGNGLDGEFEYIGGPEPYGFASAIETDGASKAFYGHNVPFSDAARISVSSDPLIEIAGDLTLEGWFQLPTGAPGASHAPQMYFGKGSGNPIVPLSNSFFLGTNFFNARFVGGLWDSAETLWTVTSTLSTITPDTFYHL